MNLCLAGLFYLFQKNALLFSSFAPEKLFYFLVRGDLIEDGLSKDALALLLVVSEDIDNASTFCLHLLVELLMLGLDIRQATNSCRSNCILLIFAEEVDDGAKDDYKRYEHADQYNQDDR